MRTVDAAPVPSRIVISTTSESRQYSSLPGNRNSSQTAWRARLGATENSPLVRTAPRHMLGLTPSQLTNGSAAERHFMARILGNSLLEIVPHRVGHTHRFVDQDRGGAAARYSTSVPAGQTSQRAGPSLARLLDRPAQREDYWAGPNTALQRTTCTVRFAPVRLPLKAIPLGNPSSTTVYLS